MHQNIYFPLINIHFRSEVFNTSPASDTKKCPVFKASGILTGSFLLCFFGRVLLRTYVIILLPWSYSRRSREEYVQMDRHDFHLNEAKSVVFADFANGLLDGFLNLTIYYFYPIFRTKHYVVVIL
ncbi:hypothetical protein Psfp_04094 [Pelotomaculum sp. FP]|nr:hypothetical protein Psfp_04094 [Pelotomaculum sp. FP]